MSQCPYIFFQSAVLDDQTIRVALDYITYAYFAYNAYSVHYAYIAYYAYI